VRETIESHLKAVEKRIESDAVDPSRWGQVFGHMKNADLVAQANDPEAKKPMRLHEGWALDRTTSQVKVAIESHIKSLRKHLSH
jgi:hypothetical protein